MFDPGQNPNYNTLLGDARNLIVQWTEGSAWYAGSHVTPAP